jgi:hypothetical protein
VDSAFGIALGLILLLAIDSYLLGRIFPQSWGCDVDWASLLYMVAVPLVIVKMAAILYGLRSRRL